MNCDLADVGDRAVLDGWQRIEGSARWEALWHSPDASARRCTTSADEAVRIRPDWGEAAARLPLPSEQRLAAERAQRAARRAALRREAEAERRRRLEMLGTEIVSSAEQAAGKVALGSGLGLALALGIGALYMLRR